MLIDAAWWFGGNRQRGIGRYLDAYFHHHCPWQRSQRRWLVPDSARDEDVRGLVRQYGGQAVKRPSSWLSFFSPSGVKTVFFPSVFERPHSLIDELPRIPAEMRREAIVFDLLPAKYPQEVLAKWPESDQRAYWRRLNRLAQLDGVYAISLPTALDIQEKANVPKSRIKVLEFGLRDDWIRVPPKPSRLGDRQPLVVTISGGEWHKNLLGALEYFRDHYARTHKLVVICGLGRRGIWHWRWRAWRLGIGQRVSFVGAVTEARKWQFLRSASVFLFLSHAEGLGIPYLEARRAQVPHIVTSPAVAAVFGSDVPGVEVVSV